VFYFLFLISLPSFIKLKCFGLGGEFRVMECGSMNALAEIQVCWQKYFYGAREYVSVSGLPRTIQVFLKFFKCEMDLSMNFNFIETTTEISFFTVVCLGAAHIKRSEFSEISDTLHSFVSQNPYKSLIPLPLLITWTTINCV
jgi:hypothetical protein